MGKYNLKCAIVQTNYIPINCKCVNVCMNVCMYECYDYVVSNMEVVRVDGVQCTDRP